MKRSEINHAILTSFFVVHVVTAYLLALTDFAPEYLWMTLGMYCVRWLGFTCAVHRYFSHKSFRTSRSFQFFLGVWGTLTMARSPIRFSSGHRHHHLFSDRETDLHSAQQSGLLYAYIGWVISKRYDEKLLGRVGDLIRYPELRLLNRFYFLPNLVILYAMYEFGGLPALTYGGLLSIIVTWHVAFSVTVLFHKFGRQQYETGDRSLNSGLLALLTFGEGWHNNHHANMSSAKLGHEWWQIDLGYYVLLCFESLGLIWDLNRTTVPRRVLHRPTHAISREASVHVPDRTERKGRKAA